jgi:hypothetical protein
MVNCFQKGFLLLVLTGVAIVSTPLTAAIINTWTVYNHTPWTCKVRWSGALKESPAFKKGTTIEISRGGYCRVKMNEAWRKIGTYRLVQGLDLYLLREGKEELISHVEMIGEHKNTIVTLTHETDSLEDESRMYHLFGPLIDRTDPATINILIYGRDPKQKWHGVGFGHSKISYNGPGVLTITFVNLYADAGNVGRNSGGEIVLKWQKQK